MCKDHYLLGGQTVNSTPPILTLSYVFTACPRALRAMWAPISHMYLLATYFTHHEQVLIYTSVILCYMYIDVYVTKVWTVAFCKSLTRSVTFYTTQCLPRSVEVTEMFGFSIPGREQADAASQEHPFCEIC